MARFLLLHTVLAGFCFVFAGCVLTSLRVETSPKTFKIEIAGVDTSTPAKTVSETQNGAPATVPATAASLAPAGASN